MRASRGWLVMLAGTYLAALGAPWIAPYAPDGQDRERPWLSPAEGWESRHWLGTDGLGRDQLSRLLWGGQTALFAGTLGALAATLAGGAVGGLAGLSGGWIDRLLMRAADVFLALPWLYFLLAARAALPLDVSPGVVLYSIVLVLGLVGWARPARIVRGLILVERGRESLLAARGFGGSRWYLLRQHLLPAVLPALLVQGALLIPQFVLAEATLTYLGLGFSESQPSWGNLLAGFARLDVLMSRWWMGIPAVVFGIVFMSFHSMANALSENREFH